MTKILLCANTDWYLYNFRRALATHLLESGFDVVLVSPSGEYTSNMLVEGFQCISWKLSRKGAIPWEEFKSLLALISIYWQEQPDIVHHHTIKPVLYGTLAACLAGVPGIVNSITGRGYVFLNDDYLARLLRVVIKPIYTYVLKHVDSVAIFENQFDRNYFEEMGMVPQKRSWLIEGVGTDPEKFFPTLEPVGKPVVLFAGRMLWDKGVGVFVEAARIIKSMVDVRFILVGVPDPGNPGTIDEGELREWQNEGVVEWWGWQSDMVPVYQGCHIVVLPTMYGEGVPTTLIEGAACGKPLVGSNIPGCLTIVRPGINGLLVPPNEPEALASALMKLITDPALRKKMGEASRKIFLEKFTYHQVNEATLKVYNHLLDSVA